MENITALHALPTWVQVLLVSISSIILFSELGIMQAIVFILPSPTANTSAMTHVLCVSGVWRVWRRLNHWAEYIRRGAE